MTEYRIPLPPDDLVLVWDKDGDRWMRLNADRGFPGGVWRESITVGKAAGPSERKWSELVAQFGPVTDYEPRCEAYMYLGEDREAFRCLLAPNHSGHHKLPENCWTDQP